MNDLSVKKKQTISRTVKLHMKQKLKKINPILLIIITFLFITVIVVLSVLSMLEKPKDEASIITTAFLEKIISISELNTFQAVYNGVTAVMNEKKPEKTDYYVSYEAKVKAGIDMDKIKITGNEETKTIVVTIPEVKINEVIVDAGTLDYMFVNDKANTSGVSGPALKACQEDATKASETELAIIELAEKNARNIIEALIRPFVGQLDAAYTLIIN